MKSEIYNIVGKILGIKINLVGYLAEYVYFFNKKYSKFKIIKHYMLKGRKQGLDNGFNPSKMSFDPNGYMEQYLDLADMSISPWEHYTTYGLLENRQPFNIHEFRPNNIRIEKLVPPDGLQYNNPISPEQSIKCISYDEIRSDAILIFLPGNIGDIVACEPIVRYLKFNYSKYELYWICKKPYSALLKYNQYLNGIIVLDTLPDIFNIIYTLKPNHKILNCIFDGSPIDAEKGLFWHNSNLNINFDNYYVNNCLLSAFASAAGLPKLFVQPIFWSSSLSYNHKFPSKYFVVHCKSSGEHKDWPAERFNKLVKFFLDRNIAIVEIGTVQVINYDQNSNYFNMTHVRDFHEINAIIKNSSGLIGIDSCFLHFANANKIRAVGIFFKPWPHSTFNPYSGFFEHKQNIRMVYPENGNLVSDISLESVVEACRDMKFIL